MPTLANALIPAQWGRGQEKREPCEATLLCMDRLIETAPTNKARKLYEQRKQSYLNHYREI